MTTVIARINPVLRGWAGYFKLSQSKRLLGEADGKGASKAALRRMASMEAALNVDVQLDVLGLRDSRSYKSAFSGRGPWWCWGESHTNQALPKTLWAQFGLVSVLFRYWIR